MESAENEQSSIVKRFIKKHKKLKVSLVVLSLILIGFFIFIHFFLTNIVKQKIITSVNESSKGLYSLDVNDFELRFWRGAVYMGDVQLSQDTVLLEKLRKEDPSANLSNIDVKINEVIISRIWWQNFIFNRSLKVGAVQINKPEFSFKAKAPTDTLKVSKQSFLEVLPGIVASFAGSLEIEEIHVAEGKLQYDVLGEAGLTKQKADSVFLEMKDIQIDTTESVQALYTNHVRFSLNNYELITGDQLFKLHIEKIAGSYEDSLLSIESISFTPLDTIKKGTDNYDVTIKSIQNTGIDFSLFFKEKKVSLGTMAIVSPRLNFSYKIVEAPASTDSISEGSANNFLQTVLPYIAYTFKMKRFAIEDGSFNTNVISSKGSVKQKGGNLYLNLDSILIDTITLKSGKYWHNLRAQLTNYEGRLAPQNLKINIDSINASSEDASLTVNGLVLAQLSPSDKGEQFVYNNFTRTVKATGIDYERLLYGKGVAIDAIDVQGMKLEIIQDQRLGPAVYKGQMPNEMVQALPVYFRIDEVNVRNAFIKYVNYSPEVKEPGILTFEKADLKVMNITNDPILMNSKNSARIKGQMLVMGEGTLKLAMSVPLLSKTFECKYEGSLSAMDAKHFNSFLEYGGMRLESGSIEAQSFHVHVVNGKADGNMVLLYHELNANIVNKKTGKVKKLFSKVANFVLKNDNKKKEDKGPVNAIINYKRKPEDGFLSYVWNSISEGIVDTVVKDFFEPFVKVK